MNLLNAPRPMALAQCMLVLSMPLCLTALHGQQGESSQSLIVYADGRSSPVVIEAFDGQTLTVRPIGEDAAQTLRVAEIIRVGTMAPITLPHSVWLVDGTRIAAERMRFNADECHVVNTWGEATIALEKILAVQFNGPLTAAAWQEWMRPVESIGGADDALVTIAGDVHRGTLDPATQFNGVFPGSELILQSARRSTAFSTQRLRAFIPSPALRQADVAAAGQGGGAVEVRDVWVGLADGSVLRVRRVESPQRWILACGQVLERSDADPLAGSLVMVAPALPPNGLLAAGEPLRYRHVPFFGQPAPLHRWASAGQAPPEVQGGFPNGVQVGASSRLVYRLSGETRLRGRVTVGTSPATQRAGAAAVPPVCRFVVQSADAAGKVTTRWQSEAVQPGEIASFDVDLQGAALLILGTDSEAGGDTGRGLWLDTVAP